VIASPLPAVLNPWKSLSFPSTLFLQPIIDSLLAGIPEPSQSDLRLGLQEALVNAAKHGNKLDPQKEVSVHYARIQGQFWWVITDQGEGFHPPCLAAQSEQVLASLVAPVQQPTVKLCQPELPDCEADSGRGLYILYQIFDQVHWSASGTELCLCKCGNLGESPL
jgi:serine/threonine-protein kinase RsbW